MRVIKKLNSTKLGTISIGENVFGDYVKQILPNYENSEHGEYFTKTYLVEFEKSKRTLEVFDVNYVIRDEE